MKTVYSNKLQKLLLISIVTFILILSSKLGLGQTTFTWSGATSTAWLTAGNWSPSGPPNTTTSEAFFNNNTNAGTNGINMNGISGANSSIGCIHWGSSATTARTISNSSGTTGGTYTLNGMTINSIANTIIRNVSATTHTIAPGSSTGLIIGLGNATDNIIAVDGAGGITISSVISGSGKNLNKVGSGAGVLTLSGVNTYSGNTTITGGTLSLSTAGSIASSPNITIGSGATFNVTGLTTALSLGAGQTLKLSATGANTTGTLTVTNTKGLTLSAGGIAFTAYGGGGTPPLTVTGASAGALALNSSPVTITTSSTLAAGNYTIIAKGGSATGVTGTPGALTVNGSGTVGTNSLSVVSGELILTVTSATSNLTTSASTLTFGAQNVLTTSSSQTFNLSGALLSPASGNITITAPNTDWTVSSDNSSFGSTATIAYTGSGFTNVPVYVKFNPQTAGTKTGVNITFSGGSVSSPPTVALTGTATVPAPTIASATNIACTSFDANWSSVTGADNYRLDVSINSSFSATPTLASDGFENSLSSFTETTGTGTFSSGSTVSGTDLPGSSPYANSGTYSYGKTNGSVTITSSNINTTATSSNQMTFKLSSFSVGSTGNGADAGDIATVEISPDGGTTYYSTVRVLGNGNAVWGYSASGLASTAYDGNGTPVDFSPAGGGVRTTDGYSTVTVTNLPSTTNLKVRITLLNNASSERWTIDDFIVSGSSTAFVTGYQDLSVGNVTTYPVNTNLTANTTYYYRVRAENTSVASANSSTTSVLVTSSGVWIGSNSGSNNWFDAVNWCGTLPTATTDVSITSGTPFAPAITGSGAVAKSINIGSSATLDINGGDLTMTATGDITNNGTLSVGSSGTLDMVSNQVLGSGTVVINGTFKTSKAAGFSGSAGTAISNSIGSLTLGSSSTVDYTSAGGQSITSGNYANISNSGNGSRTLENGGSIAISGAFSPGSGNYTTTNSTVVYNGTSAQTAVALAPASKYNNLTINNAAGVSMNADLNLEGALTLTNGVFTTTGYTFTFLSTQTQTARIAPVTGGSISGDVTIQRFVPGGDAGWTFIGMPATGRTIADWTDDITTSGFTGSTTGTGTFVSIYGYDETVAGNADASASYVGVTDASNAVDPKKGYFVFVADNATTVADKTLDITGPVLTGTQTFNVSYSANTSVDEDGWNLISNPYVSAIDWLSLNWTKTNIDDAIYIYDTEIPQYVGVVNGVSYNFGNKIIASSQAFFVHANAANPALSISENAKSTLNPTYYRSSSTTPNVLRLQLSDANSAYVDETVFQSKAGASSNFDGSFDAYKLYSFDPTVANISTRLGGIEYVVNSVDVLNSNLDLDVKVNVPVAGTFTINFVGLANYRNGVSCFTFEDKLTQTIIDLSTDSSYTFTSSIDTASAYSRFVLHFGVENIVPSITPSATTLSYPGNTTVTYSNNSTGAATYSWNFGDGTALETSANPSHTYNAPGVYTVSFTASNAAGCSESISQVITVENVTAVTGINLSESVEVVNTTQGLTLNYAFKNSTKLTVCIYNSLGEKVSETEQKTVQNNGQILLQTAGYAKGVYTVETRFNNRSKTQKITF